MARRTFTDATAELLLRLGNRSDASDTLREQWINDAMYKVGNQYEHREIQATGTLSVTNGDDEAAAPADMWWPEWVYNITDNKPVYTGDRDLIETMVKRSGPPDKFYTWGSVFFFNTLANSSKSMRLYYVQKPVRWVDGATLVFDECYDAFVMLWATKIGLTALRDLEEADAVGKEIAMYVAQHKFPLREQRKNDRLTGIQVRRR
jgi:hypothetical protein